MSQTQRCVGSSLTHLTTVECAEDLGHISPVTISRWCKQGRLPGAAYYAGIGWRIPRSSWERYKADRRAEAVEIGTREGASHE